MALNNSPHRRIALPMLRCFRMVPLYDKSQNPEAEDELEPGCRRCGILGATHPRAMDCISELRNAIAELTEKSIRRGKRADVCVPRFHPLRTPSTAKVSPSTR